MVSCTASDFTQWYRVSSSTIIPAVRPHRLIQYMRSRLLCRRSPLIHCLKVLQRAAVPAASIACMSIIQPCYGISFIFSNYWTYCCIKQRDELLLPFRHLISFLFNTVSCARGFTTSAFNFPGIPNSTLLVFRVSSRAGCFPQPPFPVSYCHVQDISMAMVKTKHTKSQQLQSKHVSW